MRPFTITPSTINRADVKSLHEVQPGDALVATCDVSVAGRRFAAGSAVRVAEVNYARRSAVVLFADGERATITEAQVPLQVALVPGSYLPVPAPAPATGGAQVTASVPLATVERIIREYARTLGYPGYADEVLGRIQREVR